MRRKARTVRHHVFQERCALKGSSQSALPTTYRIKTKAMATKLELIRRVRNMLMATTTNGVFKFGELGDKS
eukprot:3941780-Amphidinium_carterae.1